jgi:glycosyltransferase involved in cell wall biosynthesis
MPALYRMANVFVLGSLKEMMPIALLEATASGLPCIVNSHPVMQWMTGKGGMAIALSAESALSEGLERLLSEPDATDRLGRQAREHCVAQFSRDQVVSDIEAYYRRTLDTTVCRQPAAILSAPWKSPSSSRPTTAPRC